MAFAGVIGLLRRRDRRLFRDRRTLDNLRDFEVLAGYRLSRNGLEELAELLKDDLSKDTNRSMPIPVLTQVLVGLRYLAKGDFFSEVAELHGISRTSAFSIINNFVEAVNHRLDNIRFPTGDELDRVRVGFYRRCGIPNTVGALDGSLIPIVAPSQNEEVYVCRKNFHAINIQAVVDHECRFTNLVARWPGSTHDASIFENCGLKRHLDGGNVGHLLGDAGYALKRILITPVLRPATEAEKRFNNSHSSGRMVVERAFGLLKSRFRCLHKTGGCLYMRPDKCCRVIEACVRLHNYCLTRLIPMPDEPDNVGNDEEQIGQPIAADLGAVEYRNQQPTY